MKDWNMAGSACMLLIAGAAMAGPALSHPPLRTAPPPSKRAMAKGPALFADAARGNDANDGSEKAPWKTVNRAMKSLKAGDTLYLRGGTYYEQVYCAVVGTPDAPVTIRSYPGEQAVLDGGWREFMETPATAWEPVQGGADGEFRSVRLYPNARDVYGTFGDSMIGMSTYCHAMDLRAANELWNWKDWDKRNETDCDPMYCGPGLWYDAATGRIHVRLSRTNVPGVPNYQGETDPRKVPMVIAPFRSVPLFVDRARRLRLQDLVIQGGGYDTVILDYAENIELDNVTIWSGSYGMRTARVVGLKAVNCGFYGNCPPWLARSDTSKRAYPGRPWRDITRLNTHATWVIESGREFEVFATPVNDDWEIAFCEFTDSHDGPYFGGVGVDFHNNLIENTQDDGIYLSQMYPRHIYMRGGAEIRIHQNVFRGVLTALAFGGPEKETKDRVYLYRNLFDLRPQVYTGRPSTKDPQPRFSNGRPMGDHGSPPYSEMYIYHNTVVMAEASRTAQMSLQGATSAERPRRIFNNIFVHLAPMPAVMFTRTEDDFQTDANLYWDVNPKKPGDPFAQFRGSKYFEPSKAKYPPGYEANSIAADPQFHHFAPEGPNDLRLTPGSPAVDKGIDLPADWPDTYRAQDAGKPDLGALPLGATLFKYGRQTR